MSTYRFSFPTPIHFGTGVRKQVAPHLKEQGFTRPLVITDRGVAGLPMYQSFMKDLTDGGMKAQTFSEIWGNPVKSQVTAGVEAYRAHKADSIVGIGGGAALDVAKAILLMINHPGDLFDYEDDKSTRPFDQQVPYWVALPTTSGTGSEVGRSAVISDDKTHLKKIIFHPMLLAKAVFADPETTIALPAGITAWVGMDALTHCVESYLAKGFHPICDGIALEGVRLASRSLVRAVREPSNLEARGEMMMSSMMGAIAFQKGLGLTHSCAHSLSAVTDMHHGLANGVMIDHALKFNLSAVPERFDILAQTVGLKSGKDFISWLTDLKKETGTPAKLSELKVKQEHLEKLSEIAIADVCHGSNPKVCTQDDFRRIFAEAL